MKLKTILLLWCLTVSNGICANNDPVVPLQIAGFEIMPNLTAEERTWIREHPVLNLAMVSGFAPFSFREGSELKGMAIDYLDLIAKRVGIEPRVTLEAPWTTLMPLARDRSIDGVVCVSKTADRVEFLRFTDTYLTAPWIVVTRTDFPEVLAEWKDLVGKRVLTLRHSAVEEKLRSQPGIEVIGTGTVEEIWEQVALGVGDAAVGNLPSASYYISRKGITNLRVAYVMEERLQLAMGIRSDWPELVGILNKAIAALTPEEHEIIHRRWVTLRYEKEVDWRVIRQWILIVAGFSGMILIFVILWNRRLTREIAVRKSAEEALRLANAYNRSLIEASLDPLVTIGPDGGITDVNAATEQVTGYAREELIGTDFSGYFTEPEIARAGYEQVFHEGFVRDYALEIKHRDGRVTSVLYNASVYRDASEQVIGVFAAARDITKRKLAEEALRKSLVEKDLLLKEIHHRVKNNLQVVIGLIQMQSRTTPDTRMIQTLKELQERVRVMALVHERLYLAHNFSEIDFGRYLQEVTENLLRVFGSPGVTLEVKVDNVLLEIETVITCGLITTEIVTNALKYAFPDPNSTSESGKKAGNRIGVEFQESDRGYILTVSDNGIGFPDGLDMNPPTSMGLHLVHLWSTYQLGGSIEVRTCPGTTFIIRFPKRKIRR